MKVKQLIEELQKMPQDCELVVLPNSNWFQNIECVYHDIEADDVLIYTKHKD